MTVTVIDIENSITRKQFTSKTTGKIHYDTDNTPYNTNNKLVSVGYRSSGIGEDYLIFYHKENTDKELIKRNFKKFQEVLDKTTLLVGHNLKYDLQWLKECGFKFTHCKIFDTYIFEYILAKAIHKPLDLESCCVRRGIEVKYKDMLGDWLNASGENNTDNMPLKDLIIYGKSDIDITSKLYNFHKHLVQKNDEVRAMLPTIKARLEFTKVLIDMENDGFRIDKEVLEEIEVEYRAKLESIKPKLKALVIESVGHTPINLDSPEQLSQALFGFKVIDKDNWSRYFNLGTIKEGPRIGKKKPRPRRTKEDIFSAIESYCVELYKTEAKQCVSCGGKRYFYKTTKKGEQYKKPTRCLGCGGTGLEYISLGERAGLGLSPLPYQFVSTGGYSTGGDVVDWVLENVKDLAPKAKEFLSLLQEYSSISVYLTNFVEGIQRKVSADDILHMSYNQCVTRTGRLSSGFHNMPRSGTFPIKKCIKSRWKGGTILNVDFSGLEFRMAALLSGDKVAAHDIATKVDIHNQTSKYLTDKGQETDRQEAKEFCVTLDSQILTKTGWKFYDEVVVGEDVLAYDTINKLNVWTPLLGKTIFNNSEVMQLRNKHNWKVKTTPNHRWHGEKRSLIGGVRKYRDLTFTSEDIGHDYKIRVAAYSQGGASPITTKEAALLGWLWGDGTESWSKLTGRTSQGINSWKRGINAHIIQKKKNTLREEFGDYIRTIKMDIVGCERFFIRPQVLRDIYAKSNLNPDSIDYDTFVLSLSQESRKSWLDAVFKAEGHHRKFGEKRITQNEGPFQRAIALAGFLEGYDIRTTGATSYTGKFCTSMTLRTRPFVGGTRITRKYLGKCTVWCPETAYGSWVMRQGYNIMITGNSFKPLFGGVTGTEAEQAYYRFFLNKYSGIRDWQNSLAQEALHTKKIISPSGMVYSFPYAQPTRDGGVTGSTQVFNYEIQGFSFEIVQITIIELHKELIKRALKSKLSISVHDSAVLDVHPEETKEILNLTIEVFNKVAEYIKKYYPIANTNVPLGYEISSGVDWYNQKKIYVG